MWWIAFHVTFSLRLCNSSPTQKRRGEASTKIFMLEFTWHDASRYNMIAATCVNSHKDMVDTVWSEPYSPIARSAP